LPVDPGKGILRTLKAELECRVFHRNNCLGTVCIYDAFPKSKIHLLVIPLRRSGLAVDNIKDLKRKHLKNLKLFHAYGKQVATYLSKSKPSTFPIKLGYHAIPSLNRLHLHIISQDFDSLCLKNKKHWNSFTQTGFFMSPQIIENHLEKEGNLANLLMNAKDLMNLPLGKSSLVVHNICLSMFVLSVNMYIHNICTNCVYKTSITLITMSVTDINDMPYKQHAIVAKPP